MTTQTLYKIASDIRNVIELGDSGDLPDEAISDTLEALSMEFDDKLDAVLAYRQGLIHDASAYDAEIERLTQRKKALNSRAETLKDYAVNMMFAVKKQSHKGLFSVSIGKPSKVVGIEDLNLLPAQYLVTKIEPNKTEIKKAIQNGETIPGAAIIDGKPRITIK
jgi:hypothetical protein